MIKNLDNKKINVLGQEYTIKFIDKIDDDNVKTDDKIDGQTDWRKFILYIRKDMSKEYTKEVIRHEILHAFMRESGLDEQVESENSWVHNEGLIDWLSI